MNPILSQLIVPVIFTGVGVLLRHLWPSPSAPVPAPTPPPAPTPGLSPIVQTVLQELEAAAMQLIQQKVQGVVASAPKA